MLTNEQIAALIAAEEAKLIRAEKIAKLEKRLQKLQAEAKKLNCYVYGTAYRGYGSSVNTAYCNISEYN